MPLKFYKDANRVTNHYASRNFHDLCTDSGRPIGDKTDWEFKVQLRQRRGPNVKTSPNSGEPQLSLPRYRTPSRARDCFFNQGAYNQINYGNFSEVSNRVENRLRFTPASSIAWELGLRHSGDITAPAGPKDSPAKIAIEPCTQPHPSEPRFLKDKILPDWVHLCGSNCDQNVPGWAKSLRDGIKSDSSLIKLQRKQDSVIESDPKLLYLSSV